MNIIFDIGKVLIDFDYESFVRDLLGEPAAEKVIEATWKSPYWIEFDKGNLSDEEVLRLFISRAPDCEKEIREVFARLGSVPKMRPTTIPMIDRLKAEGHKVYFLSNYFQYLIHVCPWALEFRSHMDGGVFSCFEHLVKPMPEIYQLLCDRYSLDPKDSVFIDDSPVNVEGAERFGIRAILYTGQTPDQLHAEIFG